MFLFNVLKINYSNKQYFLSIQKLSEMTFCDHFYDKTVKLF